MTGSAELSLTQTYRIGFVIRRSENDGVDLPCVVDWSPYSEVVRSPGLVLLCHNAAGGVDPVPVDLPGNLLTSERDDGFVVTGWEGYLCQLEPGAEDARGVELPECYYKAMRAGETYTLLYPGHEILMWDWGTLQELTGREIKKRAPATTTTTEGSSPPNPVIPGGPAITFKAVEEDPPWPDRAARLAKIGFDRANWEESQWRWKLMRKREGSPPPMREAERSPGAPIVTATLSCPPRLDGDEDISVQVTFTYKGVAGPSGTVEQVARPITFHFWVLYGARCGRREGWRLDRRATGKTDVGDDGEGGSWQECEMDHGEMGYLLVGEDVEIRVGRDKENFVSLMPGEAWATSKELQSKSYMRSYIPTDVVPGETFRPRYKGMVMDWWDWGTMADHADTVVKLPSFIAGRVTEPADNGGRPRLVVPAAEDVMFTYTGAGKGMG